MRTRRRQRHDILIRDEDELNHDDDHSISSNAGRHIAVQRVEAESHDEHAVEVNQENQRQHFTSTASDERKQVRGPTTLAKLFTKSNGVCKIKVNWSKHKQPIGRYQFQFKSSIGILMQSYHRFDWTKDWDDQSEENKDWLWANLNDVWDLEESMKEHILGKLSSRVFRNKKSGWKMTYYKRHRTFEDRLKDQPKVLSNREWEDLLKFWETPEHIKISTRNKDNQSKQKDRHATGTKSFVVLRDEMEQENGMPPSHGEFFVRSHISKRTNDAIDEQSRNYIAQMRELAGTDEDGNSQQIIDEIFREVMPPERHGRVRGMGPGVTPTSLFGSTHITASIRIEELEHEVDDVRDEMARQLQAKDEQTKHEIEKLMKENDEEMEKRLLEQKEDIMKQVHAMFQQIQHSSSMQDE